MGGQNAEGMAATLALIAVAAKDSMAPGDYIIRIFIIIS